MKVVPDFHKLNSGLGDSLVAVSELLCWWANGMCSTLLVSNKISLFSIGSVQDLTAALFLQTQPSKIIRLDAEL